MGSDDPENGGAGTGVDGSGSLDEEPGVPVPFSLNRRLRRGPSLPASFSEAGVAGVGPAVEDPAAGAVDVEFDEAAAGILVLLLLPLMALELGG